MVASGTENVRAGKFDQGTRKTRLEGFCYKKVFSDDEMMECSALREPELTARGLLRREKVGKK